MRSGFLSSVSALFLLVSASETQALPITDIYYPGGSAGTSIELSTDVTHTYEHTLLPYGFNPLTDILGSVTLTLNMGNQAEGNDLEIDLDGNGDYSDQLVVLNNVALTVNVSYLQSDGLLTVDLTKTSGPGAKFTFNSSTLFAQGRGVSDSAPTSAPEPASLLLFGAGATILARHMRRRPARS